MMSWLDLRSDSLNISPEEENCMLLDRFFFGMGPCLQETIRHLFNQNIDFGDLLLATQ